MSDKVTRSGAEPARGTPDKVTRSGAEPARGTPDKVTRSGAEPARGTPDKVTRSGAEPARGTPDTVGTGGPAAEGTVSSRMSRLFDLRYVIAGLLGLYGIVLVIRGLTDDDVAIAKAAGLAVNLWTGIGMLVVAALFGAWALLRPLGIEVGADADTLTTAPETHR